MSIQIKLKNSVVQDSTPSTSDLPVVGELALNANINSIGGFMRASDNTIVKIFGPGSVTTPTATTTVSGISELATNTETTTGTATNRVVTPAGLNAVTTAERSTSNTNYVAKAGSTMTGVLTATAGSNSAPAINFGDSDSGIFGGTNTVSLAAGGTTRLTADTGVSVVGTLAVTGAITSTSDLTIPDKIIHSGDTNTAIRFPAVDTVSIETNSSERTRVDSSGRLLVGTSTARSNYFNTSGTHFPRLQVESANNNDGRAALALTYGMAATTGPYIALSKHRSNSIGGNTIVQENDELGLISFQGNDGAEFVEAATIKAEVDGTPGSNDMPGRLVFGVARDNFGYTTTRLTIDSAGLSTFTGNIEISNTSPNIQFTDTDHNSDFNISTSGGNFVVADSTNGQNRVLIASDGTVDIQGNLDANGGLDVTGAITGTGDLTIDTNTLHVDSSNNRVGIGTTSPSALLDVELGSTGTIAQFRGADTDILNIDGDSDQITFDARNVGALAFEMQGSEAMRIDSSGRLLLGTSASLGVLGLAAQIQIAGNSAGGSSLALRRFGDSAQGAFLTFSKSRNAADGSRTIVQNGDELGRIPFCMDDGTDLIHAGAEIRANVDGIPGANDTPGRLVFMTTADGASSPTERLRINSSGHVLVATSSDSIYNDTSGGGFNLKTDGQFIVKKQATSSADPLVWLNDTGQTTNKFIVFAQDGSEKANIGLAGNDATITVAGTERMRIDTSGRVGINQTSFATSDTMLSISELTGHLEVGLLSKNDSACVLNFGDPESYNIGRLKYANDDNSMRFDVNASERMRIDSDGNVMIGTTTKGANGADELTIATSGDTGISIRSGTSSQGAIYFGDGTSGSDNFRGILRYFHNTNAMVFNTDSSERMRIDSAGNIGIGTASPSHLLHVQNDSVSTTKITVQSTGANSYPAFRLVNDARAYDLGLDGATDAFRIYDVTGTSERMRIDTSGNVGIGTSLPDQKLHVHKGSAGSISSAANSVLTLENDNDSILQFLSPNNKVAQLRFGDPQDNGAGYIDYNHGNNALTFGTAGPEKMRITSTGKVGINTSDPQAKLQVNDTNPVVAEFYRSDGGTNDEARIALGALSTNIPSQRGVQLAAVNIGAGHSFDIRTSNTHSLGPTTKMRVKNDGNTVLDSAGRSFAHLAQFTSTHDGTRFGIAIHNTNGGGGSQISVRFHRNDTDVGSITTTGSATAFNTSSDYRLKENVVSITDGITRIKQLLPKRFNWIADSTNTLFDGFLAHEVSSVVPEAITGTKDEVALADDEQKGIKKDDPIYQSIDQSKLVPLLVAAVQELITKVEALEGA